MSDWAITSNEDLMERVYAETNYDDEPDSLPRPTLATLVQDAKVLVEAKTGSSNWYSDNGLGLILLGVTCIKAKSHIENYSVQNWDLGATEIEVRDSDGSSIQMLEYQRMIDTGMSASEYASPTNTLSVTNSFIG